MSCHPKRAYYNYLHVATVVIVLCMTFLFFVIVLLITIFVDVYDVTLLRFVFLSQLLGGTVPILQRTSRPRLGCPQSFTQGSKTDYHVLGTKP